MAAVAIVALIAVAAAGLILYGRSGDSSATAATSISVGDCFVDFGQFEVQPGESGSAVESVDRIGCDETHALEAYYVGPAYDSFDDGYPDAETIDEVAVTSCRQRFERFVGADWETSELDFWWLTPSAAGWDAGDRDLVCFVGAYDKSMTTGTLEGAGR